MRLKRYVERNFDELAIAAVMAKVITGSQDLDGDDELVLEAFRRTTPELTNAELDDLREYLERFDEDQLAGIASNVKGIAHEIHYVELENADGDLVSGVLFENTNHPGTDVILSNGETGETWELQLKATDSAPDVREWIEAHPDGQIQVTSELADKLGVESSGISNEELTANVDELIDKALDDPSVWDYFPHLTVVSMSIIIYRLARRYQHGLLSRAEFVRAIVAATGWKIAKITALMTLLSIPVLNVVTGTVLVARLLLSGREIFMRSRFGDSN